MEYYIVYIYCDYRKEIDIQHIKLFDNREKAINFAKKYSSSNPTQYAEYVGIHGTEYDSELIYYDESISVDDKFIESVDKELGIKKNMWHLRIAIDKVIMNED